MLDQQLVIQQAVRVLKDGGIIIYPTDTAFGMGCKLSAKETVQKLFTLRKRSETKAVPVLASSLDMTNKYVSGIDSEIKDNLINKYWPGALTIVLKANQETVPGLVRGGGETVGIRIPDHKAILEIIAEVGEGIVGCSANFAGEKTPYTFEAIDPELIRLVDYVIPGETNGLHQTSTVMDCSVKPWKVLREGAVQISLSS